MNKQRKKEKELMEYLFKKMKDMPDFGKITKREEAKDILKKLESDPELFQEFNTLLRNKKLKKIKDGR